MATEPDDDQRHAQDLTEYAPKTASGSKPGSVLSAWSLVLGGIALLLIISGLLMI
jgi:hypothetical protein